MPAQQVTDSVWFWYGGANCSLVLGEGKRAVLIDSGLDASNARKLWRPFAEDGWQLSAIINTHSHTDHIGGNAEMQRRTGAAIYAPSLEHFLIEHPMFEPQGLFCGVLPPPSLQVKFLLAQPSRVTGMVVPGVQHIGGVTLEAIPIPGHSPGQLAIAAGGVLFVADGCFRPEVLARHPITYMVDVGGYLASLAVLAARPERYIVFGHGPALDRLLGHDLPAAQEGESGVAGDRWQQIMAVNRAAVEQVLRLCRTALVEPASSEAVLADVCRALGKQHDNDASYYLDRAAVHAFLSYLCHSGEIEPWFNDGARLWRRV